MVDAPVETLLKLIIKAVKKEPAAPIIIEMGLSTSGIKLEPGIKKEKKSLKNPISSKPSTSKRGGWKKAALSGAPKGILKKIGVGPKLVNNYNTDEDGGYTPKGQAQKGKKTEVEKLKRGLGRLGLSHETKPGHGRHRLRKHQVHPPPGDEGEHFS